MADKNYRLNFEMSDGTVKSVTFTSPQGEKGEPGADGYSPGIITSSITGGHRIRITDKDGTVSFDVMDGTDGISPIVAVEDIDGGHRVTITDAEGSKTFDVMDGKDGTGSGDGNSGSGTPWLVGTAEEITPSQVMEAVQAERGVMITVGSAEENLQFTFTHFSVLNMYGTYMVISSLIASMNDVTDSLFLIGSVADDTWSFSIAELASSSDIPTALPSPYYLTVKDSSGNTIGSYNGSQNVTVTIPTVAGADGADGYTPVKGVDYWTDADQESIVQQVIAALGTPVFGRVDENNNIILTGELTSDTYTLVYEDADGNQTYIGTINGGDTVSYINRLSEATDANGAIYNGKGWMENMRISVSSGFVETAYDGTMLTGFIPVSVGDIIRLKNVVMPPTTSGYKSAVYSFDANKAGITNTNITADTGSTFEVVIEDENVVQFTISAHFFNSDASGSGYIRINAEQFTSSSIITVNQEIV